MLLYFWIYITSCGKEIKCSAKLAFYLFSPTCLINSIKHSFKILYFTIVFIIAPATPIVDVTRCSRSEDAVVLALCPPKSVHDLVDQYEVHFCSEEQKNIELEV